MVTDTESISAYDKINAIYAFLQNHMAATEDLSGIEIITGEDQNIASDIISKTIDTLSDEKLEALYQDVTAAEADETHAIDWRKYRSAE